MTPSSLEARPDFKIIAEIIQPGLLQGWIVIMVEVVDPDYVLAALEQGPRGGGADEARGPGDENGHAGSLGGAVPP